MSVVHTSRLRLEKHERSFCKPTTARKNRREPSQIGLYASRPPASRRATTPLQLKSFVQTPRWF
jgi:hypothetical protein